MTDEEKRSEEEAEAPEAEKAEDESKSDESGSDESKSDESGSDESKSDESKSDESGSDESKSDESGSDEQEEKPEAPAEAAKDERDIAAAAAHDHGESDHGHGHGGHDDHLGHTAPMSLLIGVLVALSMLTVLTVAVTAIDLGSEGNFIVAMVIATVKAILVMGYFMHMFWDSKFNVVAFTSSFLFVLLFLAMTLLDRAEYQQDIDDYENDKKAQM